MKLWSLRYLQADERAFAGRIRRTWRTHPYRQLATSSPDISGEIPYP